MFLKMVMVITCLKILQRDIRVLVLYEVLEELQIDAGHVWSDVL